MHTDLESDFLVLLYDVARQMRTVTDQMAQEHGSTRAQCIILARLERQPGMSQNEVRTLLGKPKEEVVFGAKSVWTYPAFTVVFEAAKVVEVKF